MFIIINLLIYNLILFAIPKKFIFQMKRLSEIFDWFDYIEIYGDKNQEYNSIFYNSLKVIPNSLFVAIRGSSHDGHNFIQQAIFNGARIIVCEELPEKMDSNITYVKVRNSRKSLAELSDFWFNYPAKELKMIGITGTNGKTTTAFIIQSFLKKLGKKSAVIGTTGIFFDDKKIPATHTTPESLELFGLLRNIADSGIEYVIMEVSSHSLTQFRVFGIGFKVGIFTNLTHDHLDYHKTMENYAKAKKILFDNLSENSIAIVNYDSPFSGKMLENCKSSKKYYISRLNKLKAEKSDKFDNYSVLIDKEKISIHGNTFNLKISNSINQFHLSVKSPLIGRFNIDNLTYAIAAIQSLDFDLPQLDKDTDFIHGASGRMELVKLRNGAIGIVDYAHTPDALEKALMTLREIHSAEFLKSKLICVFGCGGNRDAFKRPMMGKIASELSDLVILTSDNPRNENPEDIISEIFSGIDEEKKINVKIVENRLEAIKTAFSLSEKNDIILLAGKGHEDYQIIGSEKFHFDDKEVLKSLA